MSVVRVIYHLARADFYERVRRYSFLVMLGLIVFLGYQVAIGNMTLTLGQYRGEFNSAWVGALMSLNATFMIGWFGFYLVKGSLARDRETGVGQIMATTPLNRPLYLVGKWLSNFTVLMALVTTLALAGIIIQLWQGESTRIDLLAYLAPFLFIVLPLMALVAAIAVLFEAIPFLQGGLGNIVYFILFIMSIPMTLEGLSPQYAVFEPTGIGLLDSHMRKAVLAAYPDYNGGFSLGPAEAIAKTFTWTGLDWTLDLILGRGVLIVLAILLVMVGALFFDRFDPSRARPKRIKAGSMGAALEASAAVSKALPSVHLTPLNATANRANFFSILNAELKILLNGQRWWWYTIAGGLILAGALSPATSTRQIALPLAWAWPVLIWSATGNREIRYNAQQMVFSAANPVGKQLPAQWLAGFILSLGMGSGALLSLILAGDATGLLAWFSGALFIPSLALACGVWSRTSKLFEIIYIVILYIGPLNRVPELDFSGANSSGRPEFFIPLSIALIAFAIFGRARQVRS
jgi:hypothetical protein